ncbi:MAG: primosomal protein N', partial [Elusimicrobiaceae bacterium]
FSPDMLSAPDMEAMLSAFDEKPFEDAGTGDSARVVSFFKTDAVVPVGSEPVPQETAAAPEQEQTAPSPVYSGPRTLTQDQSAALEKLGPLVREKKRGVSLLFGDSLTGKTEIFLQLMQTALACGRQSLLLLPDIVLTQPFMDEISARLGADRTVLWHSRLTARQKNIIFNRLSSGESVVVAGTRSACLLPFKNLGVVFVDEEHDDSYKQEDQKPYYHAREVAVWRGGFHGCPVVFSSAVPSMETLRFATEGRIALIRLSQTVRKAAMPSVILTGKKGAKSPYISDVLYDKLDSTLARRQQAMLIINRLGYAAAYACLNCGWSLPCPKCGRTMGKQAEGQETAHLKCGFCGTKADLPKECPKCRNRVFKTVGSGTQRAIVEVQKLFPDARIVRVDSDTIKGKKSEGFTAWQQINSDNADIIIGTKLITRGYRFPKLSLAAFIDADTELNFPDFRASEKTCQMLFQAKGRLLYGTGDPVFIIQTAKADDAAFQAVVAGDYLAFGKEELQLRKDLSYPPYSRIIRVTVRAQNASSALKICGEVSASAAGVSADGRFAEGKDFEVMGPTACYQPKTAKGAYYQFLFKSADSDFASELMNAVSKIKVRRPAVIKIIADPSDFH